MEGGHPMDERRRCSAMSKRSGLQCRRAPSFGATVCAMHGSKAPQVQRSARQRIAELHDPAIRRYARALRSDDDKTALRAAGDVMRYSLDYMPPAPQDPDKPPYDYSRLADVELDLLTFLIEKLAGAEPDPRCPQRMQLTCGPARLVDTQGTGQLYPVIELRFESVPVPNRVTAPLTEGQVDAGGAIEEDERS